MEFNTRVINVWSGFSSKTANPPCLALTAPPLCATLPHGQDYWVFSVKHFHLPCSPQFPEILHMTVPLHRACLY